MAAPVPTRDEPNKGRHRAILLVFVGVLLALVGAFVFMSLTSQPKVSPGNTEARPGMVLLTRR